MIPQTYLLSQGGCYPCTTSSTKVLTGEMGFFAFFWKKIVKLMPQLHLNALRALQGLNQREEEL